MLQNREPHIPGPHRLPPVLAISQKCSPPFELGMRKGQVARVLTLSAIPPSCNSHPDPPPHLTWPSRLCLPQGLWEQACWSLGIYKQAGHEEPLGFGSPGAALLMEEDEAGHWGKKKKKKNSLMSEKTGTEGFGLWAVGLSFFIFLSFF